MNDNSGTGDRPLAPDGEAICLTRRDMLAYALDLSHLAANLASVARNLQDGGFCTPAEVTPIAHVAKALAEQAAKECEK